MIESFKGREVRSGDKVFAYRNLHRECWSLRATSGPHKGKVVGHATEVGLLGCDLRVSQAGRRRVLREGRKNVHAGVEGIVCFTIPTWGGSRRKVYYNPYWAPSFMVNGFSVTMASFVHLDAQGKAWAIGSVS